MAQKSAEQIIEKYQRSVSGAGNDYSQGVQNPTRPWSTATIQGANRWRAGLQQAMQERRFEQGVQAAGDQKWQARASSIGAQRYQAAAQEAAQAFAKVAGQVIAAGNAARQAATAMPNETQEQRIQRAVASMRTISEYWKSRSRRS